MARMIGIFRVYLIIIRIFYFLLLLLFLIMGGVGKTLFLSLFLPSMVLNLLFVTPFFARLSMKWKIMAFFADLLLLFILIPGIGQLSSPLFLYSYTTLLLFSTYLNVKTVLLIGILFYLTLYFLLWKIGNGFPVPREIFVTVNYYGQFFLIVALILFFYTLQIASYGVPSQPGTLWTVFEIQGDTITPKNIMSYVSNPHHPGPFGLNEDTGSDGTDAEIIAPGA